VVFILRPFTDIKGNSYRAKEGEETSTGLINGDQSRKKINARKDRAYTEAWKLIKGDFQENPTEGKPRGVRISNLLMLVDRGLSRQF